MEDIKRIILIILDSVGVGSLPDAPAYGDEGANTRENTDGVDKTIETVRKYDHSGFARYGPPAARPQFQERNH